MANNSYIDHAITSSLLCVYARLNNSAHERALFAPNCPFTRYSRIHWPSIYLHSHFHALVRLTLSFTPSPHPFTGPTHSSVLSATLPWLTDTLTLIPHKWRHRAAARFLAVFTGFTDFCRDIKVFSETYSNSSQLHVVVCNIKDPLSFKI